MVRSHAIQMLSNDGYFNFSVKIKEFRNGKYPAYAVYVKTEGQRRGKHVLTLVYPNFIA